MYRHRPAFNALVIISFICFLAFGFHATAATITQVKGEQALIDLQGEGSQYPVGSRHLVMVDGKRRAVVEIAKVKGDKAIAKVLKGTASAGGSLAALPGAGSSSSSGRSKSANRSKRSRSQKSLYDGLTFGANATYGIAGQNVTKNAVSTPMNGSALGVKAFGDYPITNDLGLIGRVGFENFSVSGNSSVQGPVKTSLLFLNADLLLRYYFLDGAFRVFPLVGLGLTYPLSKSSDVLDLTLLTAQTVFFGGGGFNYAFSDSMYATVSVEYVYFPPGPTVTTSLIDIRAGVGFQL